MMHSCTTQFDQFDILTEKVYIEMVGAYRSYRVSEELPDFTKLIAYIRKTSDYGYVEWHECIMGEIEDLLPDR
jgi:hypothetical protein